MALSEGLTKLGVDHSVRKTKYFERDGSEVADIAIVNGWLKKFISERGQKNRTQVIEAQAAAGKPAWCIERAFLLDREEWSSLSIGGFSTKGDVGGFRQPDGTWSGDYRAEGMPSDRWDKLGIELKPWRQHNKNGHILLCAQVPWDAQVDGGNHIEWLEKTAREIRKHTDRPIRFRPHPKAYRRPLPYGDLTYGFLGLVGVPHVIGPGLSINNPPTTTFEEDLAGAHAVVCFNSNVATLATVAGVPVFTGAPCLADPIACRELNLIDSINTTEGPCLLAARQQWANDIAYKQWNLDEFKEAKPWLHLLRN